MKKMALFMFGLMLMATTVGAGQEDKKASFWNSLAQKVHKVTPNKKSTATTAVGGVRGAKNDGKELHWKGKAKTVEVGEDELDRFNQALEARKSGKNQEALKQFETFLQEFPKSSLRGDGVQAVETIKAELSAKQTVPVKTGK